MPVKIFKNCLTSGGGFGIIVKLARTKPGKASDANLENDTEKETRNKRKNRIGIYGEKDSEDSKEFRHESV